MASPKSDTPRGTDQGDGHGTSVAIATPIPHKSSIDAALAELAHAPLESLRESWAHRFGRPPPKSMSRRLLEYAAAYDAQAKVHGALKPALRRRLIQTAAKQPRAAKEENGRKPKTILSPGTRLVREWHGRSHTVEVADDGFYHSGKHYRSLSDVARAITGTGWSGPRFFGL